MPMSWGANILLYGRGFLLNMLEAREIESPGDGFSFFTTIVSSMETGRFPRRILSYPRYLSPLEAVRMRSFSSCTIVYSYILIGAMDTVKKSCTV